MKFYDKGWEARTIGKPFNPHAALAWQDGWRDADEVSQTKREHGLRTLNEH